MKREVIKSEYSMYRKIREVKYKQTLMRKSKKGACETTAARYQQRNMSSSLLQKKIDCDETYDRTSFD